MILLWPMDQTRLGLHTMRREKGNTYAFRAIVVSEGRSLCGQWLNQDWDCTPCAEPWRTAHEQPIGKLLWKTKKNSVAYSGNMVLLPQSEHVCSDRNNTWFDVASQNCNEHYAHCNYDRQRKTAGQWLCRDHLHAKTTFLPEHICSRFNVEIRWN